MSRISFRILQAQEMMDAAYMTQQWPAVIIVEARRWIHAIYCAIRPSFVPV